MFGWAGPAFCGQAGNFLRVSSALKTSDRSCVCSGIEYVEPGERFVLSHRDCYEYVYIVVDGAVVNLTDGDASEQSRSSTATAALNK